MKTYLHSSSRTGSIPGKRFTRSDDNAAGITRADRALFRHSDFASRPFLQAGPKFPTIFRSYNCASRTGKKDKKFKASQRITVLVRARPKLQAQWPVAEQSPGCGHDFRWRVSWTGMDDPRVRLARAAGPKPAGGCLRRFQFGWPRRGCCPCKWKRHLPG